MQLNAGIKGALGVAALVALAVGSYLATGYWQQRSAEYRRLEPLRSCDLRQGPCRQVTPLGALTLEVSPREIPLMQPLTLTVTTEDFTVSAVAVEIRGLNMDMGLNRTALRSAGDGVWQGETILPVCSQRRMEWEAAVQLAAGDRIEVPFPFHTTRP